MTSTQKLKRSDASSLVATLHGEAALPAVASANGLSSDIVTLSDPQGSRAEAVRALRTYIIAQHVNGGRRALAICAATPNVGCTFVAANLAVSLSQVGIKTLLIDADLRKPAVDNFFTPSSEGPGLRHFLASDDVSLGEVIEADVLPNLSVLRAGGAAQNPQELLANSRFDDLMGVCLRDYEVTILDTPPANSCADARRISNVVGYSLVVTRRDKSLVHDVKVLIDELQGDHARVVGTILNEA